MKKIIHTTLLLFITISVFAQQGINYKAQISDENGELVQNQEIELLFNVSSAFGLEYIENHTATTDANGIVQVVIGEGTPTLFTFQDINWERENLTLTVSLNLNDGTGFTNLGTTAFTAVPYALNAGATNIDDLSDGKIVGNNMYLGEDAGAAQTATTGFNLGIGLGALNKNTTGIFNTASGQNALFENTTGIRNTASGFNALFENTTGISNTANGNGALSENTTGSTNTAFGRAALRNNKTGSGNVALGNEAGRNETGSNKLYIANSGTTTPLIYGEFDTPKLTVNGAFKATGRIGFNTDNFLGNADFMIKPLSGSFGGMYIDSPDGTNGRPFYGYATDGNVRAYSYFDAFDDTWKMNVGGIDALRISESGDVTVTQDVAISGILNVAKTSKFTSQFGATADIILGGLSGGGNSADGVITSDFNYSSSDIIIRSYDDIEFELDNDNNELGRFVIKAGNNTEKFSVDETGTIRQNGATIHSSDRRLKKEIEDLNYGLAEILKLQPKAYKWKNRTQEYKSIGLIAQEVQTIINEIVIAQDDEQKTLGVSYTELIPILINAIKEQQKQIEELEAAGNTKDVALAEILKRVETLENQNGIFKLTNQE